MKPVLRKIFSISLAAVLFLAFACSGYAALDGTWSATGSMAIPRNAMPAILLPNGKVLIAGGTEGNTFRPTKTAEIYDPATGLFTPTAGEMSDAHSSHTATLLPNGKVLIVSGANGYGFTLTAELYDPATNTFSITGSLNTGRQSHTATLLSNGKVLVTGGDAASGSGIPTNSAELYDPADGTWTSAGLMNQPRAGHTATLLPSGQVLVAGGVNVFCGSCMLNTSELYNPADGSGPTPQT